MRGGRARCLFAAAVFVAAVSVWLAAPSRPPTTLVFLLAGQSNMLGLGWAQDLPKTYRALPDNALQWKGGAWVPLTPRPGGGFGPELTFASTVGAALPAERIGIVKVAVVGSPIEYWSDRHADSPYATLLTQAQTALRATPGARPAGVLWVQGENDARGAGTAAAYGARLRALVAAIRRDVDRPDLPFFCAQVNPPYRYARVVRDAQAALPAQVPGTVLVPTDGLRKRSDNLHYDSAGLVELGQRFARAYLKLVGAAK